MKIGYLQFKVSFGEPEKNRAHALALISEAQCDLLVLPELCFSGYFMPSRAKALDLAEVVDQGASFAWAKDISRVIDGAVVFGFPERDGERVFNSAAFVAHDAATVVYRKTHLFNLEKEWFDPGDTGFAVHEYRGARIGMMICFDWLFPESARTLMLRGADIICHPSNLVLPYCQDAMVTRCLENRVYAITCNRIGIDRQGADEFAFTGRSQITACKGEILARAEAGNECLTIVEIDPLRSRDKSVTAKNEILADRRPGMYGL